MLRLTTFLTVVSLAAVHAAEPTKFVPSKAYVIPKYTATEGEGYFAIIEGHNKCLYIGTHANAVNSWLVEFNTVDKNMRVAVDAHKAIGNDLKGFGSQSKIHTRNNTGASGKIYFGTKQGYPDPAKEKREDYPGGYPMVYDPKTDTTKVYPIPVPHHGINSITPDESRGVMYVSTCSDGRPGPGENSILAKIDLSTGKVQEIMDTRHIYGFICIDYLGRVYHPTLEGKIVRYNSDTDKTEILTQTIDGQPPTPESHLADENGHPINWDISPDGRTLYSLPMAANNIYTYDLTQEGDVLKGVSHGELIAGAKQTDCRAMCVGPNGTAWAAITENVEGFGSKLHLVSYCVCETGGPKDYGVVKVTNPDFTEFKDKDGKDLPFHGGFVKQDDGSALTRYVILGVCQAKSGAVYILALHPYSVLEVLPEALK